MLHELLFALSGYPGDVFIPHPPYPEKSCTFAIPSRFPLLHPAERDALNRLGHIGWIYSQLASFITSTKQFGARANDTPHGTYIQAVISTIEDILADYRNDILDMEKRILTKQDDAGEGIVPIAHLSVSLGKWKRLLPMLLSFVTKIKSEPERYHGCRLLDLLMSEARTGGSEFCQLMETMIRHAHDVLYRQLASWMIFGQLSDPHIEFFIVRSQEQDTSKDARWQRGYTLDLNGLPKHIPASLAESILFVGRAIATVKDREAQLEFGNQVGTLGIPEEMQQQHLKLLLALHSSSREENLASPWIIYVRQLQQAVQQIRSSTAGWLFSHILVGEHGLSCYLRSFRHMFLAGYGDMTTKLLEEGVQWRPQSSRQATLPSMNSASGKHRREGDDNRETQEMQTHHDRTQDDSVRLFRQRELDALLVKASMGTTAEENLKGFRLSMVEPSSSQQTTFASLLPFHHTPCRLDYELQWPIDLILSSSDIDHYGELWEFLLSVKHVQLTLCRLWQILREKSNEKPIRRETVQGRESPRKAARPIDDDGVDEDNDIRYRERMVWRLRSQMLLWINTLWAHVQANVIDTHYQSLLEVLAPDTSSKRRRSQPTLSQDMDQLQDGFKNFVRDIQAGCLLMSRACCEVMHKILRTCLEFCALVERIGQDGIWSQSKRRKTVKTAAEIVGEWTRSFSRPRNCAWTEQLMTIEQEFSRSAKTFCTLLEGMQPDIKAKGNLDILMMQLVDFVEPVQATRLGDCY